ncbi:hypothetical protein [Acinetobacter lwoffii]|uniref:hypothetical protein n=2 Tax=Acinetobacter lwoffii TaxID=28090 RepID=UPI0001BBA289|nr:hypothetical protein [Acinetobacter lwoffii]EEY90283.1 hypothetical protein HMPREF0017_01209 [Acinetobacter lwoffii SH145]MDN5651931.1 hypothetical protein [Lactococcus lactis]
MSANITSNFPHLSMMNHVKELLNSIEGSGITLKYPTYFGEHFKLNVYFTGSTILVGYQIKNNWAYHIKYAVKKTQFNGSRYWFICPIKGCKKRVDKLYLKDEIFGCRNCHKLLYPSQNCSKYKLALYKLERIEKKLKGKGVWGCPPPRPKGMHMNTYEQLSKEYSDIYWNITRQGDSNINSYKQKTKQV